MENKDKYSIEENDKRVGNIYLAAAYLAYNVSLKEIDRGDKKRQRFIFSPGIEFIWVLDTNTVGNNIKKLLYPSLDDVETRFLSNELVFPPSYPESLRNIKSIIYSS